ncbi:MAG: hypothetical protein HYS14_09395, partial [Candidatus Rokubacteria bacterium]|nr:hypothetical protein [Candidatus Rokubacteria bacterium]
MHLLARNNNPPAIVFPVNYNGVNFARALHAKGVDVVGILDRRKNPFHRTNSCEKVYCDNLSGNEAIDLLQQIGQCAGTKPVLIPIGDLQVLLLSQHREQLGEYFVFNIADDETITTMVDKTKFYVWGHQRFRFPKTASVTSVADIDHALAEMRFPVVFKPRYRTDRWHKANLPKATMYSDADELLRFYHRASEHENVFVLSEFVEGPDSNLWNSHYYYSKGEPRAIYTDQKIRQYPATLGTGAYCVSQRNSQIIRITKEMLSELNYTGIGAMEFKKDERTGEYYVIEP